MKEQINIIVETLKVSGLNRVLIDWSEKHPGEKYYFWERKGVPIRIEIGPRDVRNGEAIIIRRDTGEKEVCKYSALTDRLRVLLDDIQDALFKKATEYQNNKTKCVDTWDSFKEEIQKGNFVLAHWCGDGDVEKKIKEETQATIRCTPFNQKEERGACVYSGKPSTRRVLFARAY